MATGFDMHTGTATICIFDLDAIRHRCDDPPDWWSDEDEELKEVNSGSVLFVALGSDGRYEIEVRADRPFEAPERAVAALLKCPSGRVFVGPGEDVTGGELEPDRRQTSGRLLSIPSGHYRVEVCRLDAWRLGVSFQRTQAAPQNTFRVGPSLVD